ncbi:11233_t:CDS:2 [Acaulospora morrowiae]|uniref:11233_t:CDS:1 n=1 Tax=Acaulospora morrowiae TaxID=94023 RepID=A0A9N9FJH0_9GLOM|nr:11233_t:CDS:2 [Acaulospora morrowiae]
MGYKLKKFNGYTTEDPEEHIEEFRLWLAGSGIDVGAGHANRINVHANLVDVQGRNTSQIEVQALNRANRQNGNVIIPAHTVILWLYLVFDLDKYYTDLKSTILQLRLKNNGYFLVQLFKEAIQLAISILTYMEVRHLEIEKSSDELLLKLEEIERYTAEQLSGAYLHSNSDSVASKGHGKNNYSNNTGMTKEKIENPIKGIMASSLSQPISQTISSKSQENQITLSQNNFKKIIAGLKGTIAKGQQTLKKPPDQENKKLMILL